MIQRRAVVGLLIAASTMMLGACGFESPDQTQHEHASVQANDFSVGAIQVRDAYIAAESTVTGSKSYLVVTLVNDGGSKDSLTGVTSSVGTVDLSGTGVFDGSLPLPPKGAPVSIQEPIADAAGPSAELAAATAPAAGSYVPMQFSFDLAGTSSVEQIPVVPGAETTAVSSPVPTAVATAPAPIAPTAAD